MWKYGCINPPKLVVDFSSGISEIMAWEGCLCWLGARFSLRFQVCLASMGVVLINIDLHCIEWKVVQE